MSGSPYSLVLSSVTMASNADLRSIVCKIMINGDESVACGDRNSQLSIWKYAAPNNLVPVRSFRAHDGVVSSGSFVPKSQWFPDGAFVTGSHDKTAKVWPLSLFTDISASPVPLAVLKHEQQICFVTATDDGAIITSGWDSTCKVWTSPNNPLVMRHEDLAIWSASAIPEGYVTLGADKTIRVWTKTGQPAAKIQEAHSDVPRACKYIPSRNILVTVGNDSVLKEWQVNGLQLVQSLAITVSDNYLYSLACVSDSLFAVGSEDRCAYLVSSETGAVVELMANLDSVWAVDVMSNGDVATASADGVVRVFTQVEDRRASEVIQEAYITGLSALTFTNPALQEILLGDLPPKDSLDREMQSPGRAVLVRDGEDKIVFAWSNGYGRWLEIGKVTATKGAQREKVYDENGKEWDFCITVNLEDGRNLPLYLNYDTNQYCAARDFLVKHHLQMYYLDQIAHFIERQRKPYMVNMEDRKKADATAAANAAATGRAVFPMTTPNYITAINTEPIIRKLRTMNDTPGLILTDEQFQLLEGPLSASWWDLVYKIGTEWPTTKSWPALDILRARILEPTASSIIQPDWLAHLVEHVAGSPENDDFVVLILTRIIGNMFANFGNEAMNRIEIIAIFAGLGARFSTFSQRTQLSICNAMMNYSEFLGKKPEAAAELMDVLIEILQFGMDEETLYRTLYAVGNCAHFSGQAKQKILLRPDVLDAKRSGDYSQKVQGLFAAIVELLGQ